MLFADPSRKTAEFASGIQNKICFWLDTIKMCALCQVQTVTPDPHPAVLPRGQWRLRFPVGEVYHKSRSRPCHSFLDN